MKLKLFSCNYHYIREQKPENGIYPLSMEEFATQVDALAKKLSFISQDDLLQHIEGKRTLTGNQCLLSFDDGFAEQMRAYEYLQSKGVPAVFYVPTAPLKDKTVLSVHKLHHVRSQLSDQRIYQLLIAGTDIENYVFDHTVLKQQYPWDDDLSRKIKYFINFALNENKRELIVAKLFLSIVNDEKLFSEQLYMSNQELKLLYDAGMLGTHAATHRPLATLTHGDASKDINDSLEYFHKNIGDTPVPSISYPYGGATAISADVTQICLKAGLSFGLTMLPGVNTEDDLRQNPLMLKRYDTNDIMQAIATC